MYSPLRPSKQSISKEINCADCIILFARIIGDLLREQCDIRKFMRASCLLSPCPYAYAFRLGKLWCAN